jgi:4-hydroxybenzoate polyprenyltransferase
MAAAGLPLAAGWSGNVLAGAASFVLLNAASNALNQFCDVEADAIDKATRPLPAGDLSPASVLALAAACYAAAALLAWLVVTPAGGREFAALLAVATMATVVYSVPPIRTKRHGWLGLVTIALARGMILFVAGWATVAPVRGDPEPWYVGGVFALFLVGAAGTKDLSDVRGDALTGCRSLAVRHGPRGAAVRMAPFFVMPWFLLPLGAGAGPAPRLLHADPIALAAVAAGLVLYGARVARLMTRPIRLAAGHPHPAWWHMYAMLGIAHLGIAAAYLAATVARSLAAR